jgi:hypothetical protein
MPEISISEDQHERLEGVRSDVEDAFVDTYGHTRIEDAVEYLLDTYTPPDESDSDGAYGQIATATYSELQHVAGDVPEVPGSGLDADEMRGKLLAELGTEEFAARLEETGANGDDESETETESTTDEAGEDAIQADSVVRVGTDDADRDADSQISSEEGAGDTTAAAGNPVSAANRLLREHDDKWRESAGDTPYEVDLPDSTTASARTKDDVRQLLFRHY